MLHTLVLSMFLFFPDYPIGTLVKLEAKTDDCVWLLVNGSKDLYEVNGRYLYFASPNPGTFTFILGTIEDGKVKLEQRNIVIGSNPSLTSWVRNKTKNLPKEDKALLANNFKLALSKDFESISDMVEYTTFLNKSTKLTANWKEEFFLPLAEKLEAIEDPKKAWQEIIDGLDG